MVNEFKLKQDIVEVGKRLYTKGFVASNDGNISIRISEREILITPTGVSKGYMDTSDILKVDINGNVISGAKKPTSEMKMHLSVYRKRDDVQAIVHAHPPKSTAFAIVGKTCDKITLPEVIFSLGFVSLAEYGTPSTDEVPKAVEKHIGNSDAILLSNHGALTVGKDVYDAYYKMETLEHFAGITLYARLLGGEKALNSQQVEELFRVRRDVFGKKDILLDDIGTCGGNSAVCGSKSLNSIPENRNEDDIREKVKELVMAELRKLGDN